MNNQVNAEELIVVGEIVKCQGINGEFKVIPMTDHPKRFGELKRVFLKNPAGIQELWITNYRNFKQFVLLQFEGITDLTAAEELGRGFLYIPKNERRKLPPGRFYYDELEGLEVENVTGESLGTLCSIIETGANDVYVVRGPQGEILIPALKQVVLEVDLDQGKMKVELPEGLVE